MPCNSDYLNPTYREQELQRAAFLLEFVLKKLGKRVPEDVEETARDMYAKKDFVVQLCATLGSLTKKQTNEIVYNARNATSRDLADWWEEHLAADQEREELEAYKKKEEELRNEALLKLTKEQRRALKLPDPPQNVIVREDKGRFKKK